MKIKSCVLVFSAFFVGWLLLCGVSAFAQTAPNTTDFTGNINLLPPPICNIAPCHGDFQINGSSVLQVFQTANNGSNLYLGKSAGLNSKPLGDPNTFLGNFAGKGTTTGDANTSVGYGAGYFNVTGQSNTFVGHKAGGLGSTQGEASPAGTGSGNTVVGVRAGYNLSSGNSNIFLGPFAGNSTTSGNQNVYIGNSAGLSNPTGSNNIYISYRNLGPPSNESGTIRIGAAQTAAYVAGIAGAATNSGSPVFVDGTGKLGTKGGAFDFGQITGTLFNSQLDGVYSHQVAMQNGANVFSGLFSGVFYGDGSHLTGVSGGNYIANGTALQTGDFNINGTGAASHFNIGTTEALSIDNSNNLNVIRMAKGGKNIFIGGDTGQYDQCTFQGRDCTVNVAGVYNQIVDNNRDAPPKAVCIDHTGKLGTEGCPATSAPEEQQTIIVQQQQIQRMAQQIADLQQRVSQLEALVVRK